jgi:hypothetical protein
MAKDWTARAPEMMAVRLDVTPQVHRQIRVLAAQAGLPMSQYVRWLVEEAVRGGKLPDASKTPSSPQEATRGDQTGQATKGTKTGRDVR